MPELKRADIITLPDTIVQTVRLQTLDGKHAVIIQKLSTGTIQASVDGVLVSEATDRPIVREILKLA